MKLWIAILVVLAIGVLVAGCIGQGKQPQQNQNLNQSVNQNVTAGVNETNITVENVGNASDINDTSEIGYVNETNPF